ncbi:MAG TPA: FAD-binding oxidoreductase [Polyangia bacterium]|jgi:FAD/FMN-containing dehydrogenase
MSLNRFASYLLQIRAEFHAAKVSRVVAQLRAHASSPARGQPVSFKKKAVSHQVPKRHDRRRHDPKIDLGELDQILAIDEEARTCTAEPGVTFVDLVRATLAYGLVPVVVPELKTITVGGAVAGCALESMSFAHGGFHDSCLAYEVITGRGEVLRCTPDNEHRLIFQMMHGAFGTLGVLSQLEFRLVPAQPFVQMRYDTFATLADYQAAIGRHARERDVDFMDGIIHAPDRFVLSLGRFVARAPYTNAYDWTKVYYRSTAARREDYLKTPDYFFRYDRGVTNVHPKSLVGRLLFGKLMSSAQLLRLAEKVPHLLSADRPGVTVDLFIPFSRLDAYLRWHERALGFYPLWMVPYRPGHAYEWIADEVLAGVDDELWIDIAIYGMKQPPGRNIYRELETELVEVHGIKTLISHNYYDEDAFWRIFNKPNYDRVKQRTDPDNVFRDLYAKMCRAAQGRE